MKQNVSNLQAKLKAQNDSMQAKLNSISEFTRAKVSTKFLESKKVFCLLAEQ